MKKYIIRIAAAVPMLGSGIATIIFFIMAFEENNAWILVSISSMFSFAVCATYYEHIVIDICEYVKLFKSSWPLEEIFVPYSEEK